MQTITGRMSRNPITREGNRVTFLGKTYTSGGQRSYKAPQRPVPRDGFRVAKNKQRWHGFTLERGMIFGVFHGAYYVSTGEITDFTGGVAYYQLYRERGTKDNFKWCGSRIPEHTPLGQAIKAAALHKQQGVEYSAPKREEWESMMRPSFGITGSFGLFA